MNNLFNINEDAKFIPLGKNGKATAVDLFCGAGGVSQGMSDAGVIDIVAAVNHSQDAIQAHKKNHPDIIHLTEDIIEYQKTLPFLPKKINYLWASAECTNFSNAKGGMARDADSRSLPEYLDKYVEWTNPDYFIVENVREFTLWGEMDDNGRPIKEKEGELFNKWVQTIKALGYNYREMFLNSADFGAHTSRTRYFGVFARRGLKIRVPQPTHHKEGKKGLPVWKACKDKIDLENEGTSIFARAENESLRKNLRRPLVERTLVRIAYGLKKFHLKDFIQKYYGQIGVSSMDEPLHTITTKDRHAPVRVEVDEKFITQNIQGSINASSIERPLGAILTRDEKTMISVDNHFLAYQYGRKNAVSGLDKPCNTITTSNRISKIDVDNHFILKKHSGKHQVQSINEPLHSILTHDGKQLVSINHETFGESELRHKERREFFEKYLPEYNTDFLMFAVRDIKMRYLNSRELADITGFHPNTELGRSETLRKKHIGNAVPPVLAKTIILAQHNQYDLEERIAV